MLLRLEGIGFWIRLVARVRYAIALSVQRV